MPACAQPSAGPVRAHRTAHIGSRAMRSQQRSETPARPHVPDRPARGESRVRLGCVADGETAGPGCDGDGPSACTGWATSGDAVPRNARSGAASGHVGSKLTRRWALLGAHVRGEQDQRERDGRRHRQVARRPDLSKQRNRKRAGACPPSSPTAARARARACAPPVQPSTCSLAIGRTGAGPPPHR